MASSKDVSLDEDFGEGYNFKLVDENKDIKLECSICFLLLKEAMGTPCSHLFCKGCLQKLTGQVNIRNAEYHCPDCKQFVDETLPNAFVNRLVTGSDVYCQQYEAGCIWKGSMASYLKKHDKECNFKFVSCQNDGCQFSGMRKTLKEHIPECNLRIVKCQYCAVDVRIIQLQEHYTSCEKYPITCAYGECGTTLAKDEMENHLNTECQFCLVDCPYAKFGCKDKILRKNIETHNQSTMATHMNLFFNDLLRHQNKIDDLEQTNDNFQNEMDQLRQHNSKIENKLDEQRAEILRQRKQIKDLKAQLERKELIPYDLDELLLEGTEKWVKDKDVQFLELDYYLDWYEKIFDLMDEKKLYKLDGVMYIKIKNKQRMNILWYSNNETEQKYMAADGRVYHHSDDGLVLAKHYEFEPREDGYLSVSTETYENFNHHNKSMPFVLHPRYEEMMISLTKDYDGVDWNAWDILDLPNEFYVDDFIIVCFIQSS